MTTCLIIVANVELADLYERWRSAPMHFGDPGELIRDLTAQVREASAEEGTP